MTNPVDTFQVNIRPSRELKNRLNALAVKFNKESANKVAVEIIETYLRFWEDAEQCKANKIAEQWEAVSSKPGKLTRRLKTARVEDSRTLTHARKK